MDDTIRLVMTPQPEDVCLNSTVQYFNQSSGGVHTQYVWTLNGAQPKTDSAAAYTFVNPGMQTLMLAASARCGRDSMVYSFRTKPLPEVELPDSLVTCDELVQVSAKGVFDSLLWSNGSASNPTETNAEAPYLGFTGYKNGCFIRDSVKMVQNCEVYIPSAFSPNNDGVNDAFNLIPLNVVNYDLKIFNRWGELIFETMDAAQGWDGTAKGQLSPMDHYVYYVTGIKKDHSTFSMKGTVALIR
jgi:gliding motility-associated-like protein